MLPLIEMFGIFNPEFREKSMQLKAQIKNIDKIMENLKSFSDIYGENAWLVYDEINTELVNNCVSVNIQKGEELLVKYFLNTENLTRLSYRFHKSNFRAWLNIIETAFERLSVGDFVSAIPLVMIVIDGICLRYANGHAFSGGADRAVFDCLTSQNQNLENALKIFGKTKRKLEECPIDTPFRHGIIHGLNTNYANEFVAAKCINLLWAIVNYFERSFDEAKRIEKAESEQAPPKWKDLLDRISENERTKKLLDEWKSRETTNDVLLATSDGPNNTTEGSPEKFVASYLAGIQDNNFGKLAQATSDYGNRSVSYRAGRIRNELEGVKILSWAITGFSDHAPAISEVEVEIKIKLDGKTKTLRQSVRCIYSDSECNTLVRNEPTGSWKAMPMFIFNLKSAFFQQNNVTSEK